jgi:hypothetical protein
MEKSLNQRWKESNTTLSYKEWRRREDDKMASFDGLSATKEKVVGTSLFEKAKADMKLKGGYKEEISTQNVLGINKYVLVVGAILVVSAIGYKLYKRKK